jgi:hypothetical protein
MEMPLEAYLDMVCARRLLSINSAMVLTASIPDLPLDQLKQMMSAMQEKEHNFRRTVEWCRSFGKKPADVEGDGNCLVYSIMTHERGTLIKNAPLAEVTACREELANMLTKVAPYVRFQTLFALMDIGCE